MAEKISTLVLEVDLCCNSCYKKLKKAVCECCEIKSQDFDEKQNKVILSGPFDPEKLIQKLYCKVGCKIIKGYEIKKPTAPPAPTTTTTTLTTTTTPTPTPTPTTPTPTPKPPTTPPQKPPTPPVPGVPIVQTVFCIVCLRGHADGYCKGGGCHRPVCCRECHEGRDDGHCRSGGHQTPVCCRECSEGRDGGDCKRVGGPQYCSGYRYFSEEDSACTLM